MDENMKKAYDARHKQAYRAAFEILEALFPPEDTVEYWEHAHEHMKEIYNKYRDNPALRFLIVANENYLGYVVKEIKEHGDG